MALKPGDTLFNPHYRIIRQLGRGGFGFVYLAQDTLLGEDVAIEELSPALVGDEGTLKRFQAEARAAMRLTHKRIVRTHNVFSEGGYYFIVMEYIMPGGSLEDKLREQGSLPVEVGVRIAAKMCEGLACAHEGYATLRRELIESRRMAREREIYWRIALNLGRDPSELHILPYSLERREIMRLSGFRCTSPGH